MATLVIDFLYFLKRACNRSSSFFVQAGIHLRQREGGKIGLTVGEKAIENKQIHVGVRLLYFALLVSSWPEVFPLPIEIDLRNYDPTSITPESSGTRVTLL